MNHELATQLLLLQQRDNATREKLLAQDALYGKYDRSMQRVHTGNARALDEIISRHGWPGISLVGRAGGRAAWLVAQHALCTSVLQRKFLAYLIVAVENGEAPRRQVAMLTDRIRFNQNRPQVYGTVFDWDENGVLGCVIEDRDHVDQRRREAGLPPYQESLRQNIETVAREGGKPPPDFNRYRQAFFAWAASVGWQ